MPSWIPADDYMTNFKVGDPFVQINDGYLPADISDEALHPELKGLNPEDYPDIHKLRILSDVAPYSREYTRSLRPACNKNPRARAPGPNSVQDQDQNSGPVLKLSPGLLPALSFSRRQVSSSKHSVLSHTKTHSRGAHQSRSLFSDTST